MTQSARTHWRDGGGRLDWAEFQGAQIMFTAMAQRMLLVLGVFVASLATEWWLFNHAQAVWPGLTGRITVAAVGVGGLGVALAATAWARRSHDGAPPTLGGQKRRHRRPRRV